MNYKEKFEQINRDFLGSDFVKSNIIPGYMFITVKSKKAANKLKSAYRDYSISISNETRRIRNTEGRCVKLEETGNINVCIAW